MVMVGVDGSLTACCKHLIEMHMECWKFHFSPSPFYIGNVANAFHEDEAEPESNPKCREWWWHVPSVLGGRTNMQSPIRVCGDRVEI